jgi:UDP-2-acetamido-2-deoxy-ribo-hexuluronate aminotransferase
MEFIDLKAQYLKYKNSIDNRINKVLEHGKYIMGPEIEELENILANYVDVKHCITVASGTDSLEIALRALKIGPGDEVITTPFTWISSVEVIAQVGATPVFVDINKKFYTIDVNLIESAITPMTKAIIAVSLFGQISEIDAIKKIADKYGIIVIEDGAQSFGATLNGKKSCGVSEIGSTSFFPAKPLGCFGDGGALFTNDDDLALIMKSIRTHGGIKRHEHTHIGMNGRFDTIQAAVILGKWHMFEDEIIERKIIGERYTEALLKSDLIVPEIIEGNTHVYAQYTIRVESGKRNSIMNKLKLCGIPSAIYYPKCVHEQPAFSYLGYKLGDFPESEKASREVLSLPMHPFLSIKEQDFIINSLTKLELN